MSIKNINYIELKGCIVDELHVRRAVDNSVDLSSTKNLWQIDTYLLAKFQGTTEAGTIDNGGLQITQFAIRRRKLSEINSITLGYADYQVGTTLSYTDYTQGNDTYVYSIVPVGENGLLGVPNEVQISSDFTGYWVVDKDTNNILGFDKAIGSIGDVNAQLNQGRIQIQTFNKFPQVYYTETSYHSFTLTTVIIPSEWERSGNTYEIILNNFVNNHKPLLTKSSDGRMYVCDVSNPKITQPMNTWKGYDYITISLDFVEIMSIEDYMNS